MTTLVVLIVALTGIVTAGIVAGFFLGGHLGYSSLAGVLVLVLAAGVPVVWLTCRLFGT